MPRINSRNVVRAFIYSAGALLLAAALVNFVSSVSGQKSIYPHEPVFKLSLTTYFWIVGGVEMAVALACLFGKRIFLQLGLILWFAAMLLVYRLGMTYVGVKGGIAGYSGIISDAFGVSQHSASAFLEMTVWYLFLAGLLCAAWFGWTAWQERRHPSVKMSCWSCGLHIQFPIQQLGQQTNCPHCQAAITLCKAEDAMKMTCVLCGGHVEFPAHALGQKIPCPHCAKTITLLNPHNVTRDA